MFRKLSSPALPKTDDLSGHHWGNQIEIGWLFHFKDQKFPDQRLNKGKTYACTQRTAALWCWNVCTDGPIPPVVIYRRSNILTEESADLQWKSITQQNWHLLTVKDDEHSWKIEHGRTSLRRWKHKWNVININSLDWYTQLREDLHQKGSNRHS